MSEGKPEPPDGIRAVDGAALPPKPLPPRTIAAHSQAWNSAAKIVALGVTMVGCLVLAGIALFVKPEFARDMVFGPPFRSPHTSPAPAN